MKNKLFILILFLVSTLLLSSCSFEDEIDLPIAQLTVQNLSEQVFEINYRNMDTGDQEFITVAHLEPTAMHDISLDIGYEYEIIARDEFENTIYTKKVEIKPHQDYEWFIPGN